MINKPLLILILLLIVSCGRVGGDTGLSPTGVASDWVLINDEFYFHDEGNSFYEAVYIHRGGYYSVKGFYELKGERLLLRPMKFYNECDRPSEIIEVNSEERLEFTPPILGLKKDC